MTDRPDTTHQCPRKGCVKRVERRRLMCGGCWFSLPKPIRTRVWQSWRGGQGEGTEEHAAAMQEAIEHLPPLGERKPAVYGK